MKKTAMLLMLFITIKAMTQTPIQNFDYLGSSGDANYYISQNVCDGTKIDSTVTSFRNLSIFKNAYAVAIGSQEENDTLTRLMETYNFLKYGIKYSNYNEWSSPLNPWIGLNDSNTENTFVWYNGEIVNYLNWNLGEPNNYPTTDVGEDHVQLLLMTDAIGKWNDWESTPLPLIIEIPKVKTLEVIFTKFNIKSIGNKTYEIDYSVDEPIGIKSVSIQVMKDGEWKDVYLEFYENEKTVGNHIKTITLK